MTKKDILAIYDQSTDTSLTGSYKSLLNILW